jgi:hypothetical protein
MGDKATIVVKIDDKSKELSPVIETYVVHSELLGLDTLHKADWIKQGAELLLDVTKEVKRIEEEKEEKSRVKKIQYDSVVKPFNTVLSILKKIVDGLRERLVKENEDGAVISIPGSGKIEWRDGWKVTVMNEKEVPDIYRVVSESKLQTAVDNGLRSIPGCKIEKKWTPVVKVEQ